MLGLNGYISAYLVIELIDDEGNISDILNSYMMVPFDVLYIAKNDNPIKSKRSLNYLIILSNEDLIIKFTLTSAIHVCGFLRNVKVFKIL